MPKPRTSICLSALTSSTFHQRIQLQQINAFNIKYEAYCNFLEMISRSQQKLISSFSENMLQQYQLMKQLDDKIEQKCRDKIDDGKIGRITNSMFMLKIQNQRLKCRERLLQQKIECQKVLYRKRRQEGSYTENERKLKIQQIRLLKQQVSTLESIVDKKNQLKQLQAKQKLLAIYIPEIKRIVSQYDISQAQKQLNNLLSQLQTQI